MQKKHLTKSNTLMTKMLDKLDIQGNFVNYEKQLTLYLIVKD